MNEQEQQEQVFVETPAQRAALIDSIDDPITRRLVRVAVHVKGYAPYYAATAALFGFLAFGPRPDGVRPDGSAFGANAGRAGAVASAPADGTRGAGGTTIPSSLSPNAANALLVGAASGSFASALGGDGGELSLADGTVTSTPNLPEAPAPPEFPGFDDVDYGSAIDAGCSVKPPSPAPEVTPSREVANAQQTAEAAVGAKAPADLAPYVEDAAAASGCPDVAGSVPALPLPGLPV
ncbi:MAG TPA: hypothetical protein VM345_07335 [Acidimicrobiales bacterium]|nr:hypothetical protein [Acidimicrobiales bacterium]